MPGSYLVRMMAPADWMRTSPTDDVLFGVAPYVADANLLIVDPDAGGAYPIERTHTERLIGLTSDGAGALFTVPNSGLAHRGLHSVNPLTGELVRLFDLGAMDWHEGSLALTPDEMAIYGVRVFLEAPPELCRIDMSTGTFTVTGTVAVGWITAAQCGAD